MGIIFDKYQKEIIDDAVASCKSSSADQVFEYSGRPGTGKSTVLLAILDKLGYPMSAIIPMAYIGQAAIVMRTKGLINAKTSHSWLYTIGRKFKTYNGNIVSNDYFNRPLLDIEFIPKDLSGLLMIIDEAGSMPLAMKHDIEKHGIKIIATGDLNQLPPVGDKPAYLTGPNVPELKNIVRQGKGSAIIYIAERILEGKPIHTGVYGDVLVIDSDCLTNEMILRSEVIMCGTNATRDKINKYVRQDLLNIDYDLPVQGERVICRKNNWGIEVDGINLANGLAGIVTNMPYADGFSKGTYTMDFQPFMLNEPFRNLACDYEYLKADYKAKQDIKNDKYNVGEKFEYGYATTTHLAQGSQYYNGIYIQEYLGDVQKQLDYTGVTRLQSTLIFVKHKRKFN